MKAAAQNWLTQAAEDIEYARSALADGYFAWACFACQQSAEKALKAVVVHFRGRIEKTHRLLALVSLCEGFDRRLAALRPALDILNQYYGPTRYADLHGGALPSEQYTKAMAEEAIQFAERVLAAARRTLGQARESHARRPPARRAR